MSSVEGGLPTGTVTFLFTDLEGSTRLWDQNPDAMRDALARHDDILREAVEKHGGQVVKTTGDGLFAVFTVAHEGIRAAVAAQRDLGREALRVLMGAHSGIAEIRDGSRALASYPYSRCSATLPSTKWKM
jgi:class 3 adenylate cyclase